MASQGSQLCHGGMLPDNDLILAVAVSADNLVNILGP